MTSWRIGFITGEYPPMQGGVGDYSAIVARQMVRRGHVVFVLTDPDAGASVGVDADGVHRSPTVPNWNRAFFGAVGRWAAQHRLDIISLQYQTAAFNMAGLLHFLPSRLSVPVVTTFHDLRVPYLFPKAGFIRPWIVDQLAKRSQGVIVTNAGDAQHMQDLGITRLAQIPIGSNVDVISVPADTRPQIRQQIGADDQSLVIAHFGFVNASKGIDTLLHATAHLQRQGVPARLLMIGERLGASDPTNAAFAARIDALADELGIQPHWTGFADDVAVARYFAAADVVALPFADGMSLRRGSLQAALAYGMPIVTTQPDHRVPELIAGQHLLTVPPDDPTALAQALLTLHRDPVRRQALGQAAGAVANQFRWETITDAILAFYATILAS